MTIEEAEMNVRRKWADPPNPGDEQFGEYNLEVKEAIFKAGQQEGIREAIRRAYEYMKATHRIVDYDLDGVVSHLEYLNPKTVIEPHQTTPEPK